MSQEAVNNTPKGVNPKDYNVDLTNPDIAMQIASGQAPKPTFKKTQTSDFAQAMQMSNDQVMQDIFSPKANMSVLEKSREPVGPKTRYVGDDVDIYRFQKDYNPKGFNPFDPSNYKTHVDKETWGGMIHPKKYQMVQPQVTMNYLRAQLSYKI